MNRGELWLFGYHFSMAIRQNMCLELIQNLPFPPAHIIFLGEDCLQILPSGAECSLRLFYEDCSKRPLVFLVERDPDGKLK